MIEGEEAGLPLWGTMNMFVFTSEPMAHANVSI